MSATSTTDKKEATEAVKVVEAPANMDTEAEVVVAQPEGKPATAAKEDGNIVINESIKVAVEAAVEAVAKKEATEAVEVVEAPASMDTEAEVVVAQPEEKPAAAAKEDGTIVTNEPLKASAEDESKTAAEAAPEEVPESIPKQTQQEKPVEPVAKSADEGKSEEKESESANKDATEPKTSAPAEENAGMSRKRAREPVEDGGDTPAPAKRVKLDADGAECRVSPPAATEDGAAMDTDRQPAEEGNGKPSTGVPSASADAMENPPAEAGKAPVTTEEMADVASVVIDEDKNKPILPADNVKPDSVAAVGAVRSPIKPGGGEEAPGKDAVASASTGETASAVGTAL